MGKQARRLPQPPFDWAASRGRRRWTHNKPQEAVKWFLHCQTEFKSTYPTSDSTSVQQGQSSWYFKKSCGGMRDDFRRFGVFNIYNKLLLPEVLLITWAKNSGCLEAPAFVVFLIQLWIVFFSIIIKNFVSEERSSTVILQALCCRLWYQCTRHYTVARQSQSRRMQKNED